MSAIRAHATRAMGMCLACFAATPAAADGTELGIAELRPGIIEYRAGAEARFRPASAHAVRERFDLKVVVANRGGDNARALLRVAMPGARVDGRGRALGGFGFAQPDCWPEGTGAIACDVLLGGGQTMEWFPAVRANRLGEDMRIVASVRSQSAPDEKPAPAGDERTARVTITEHPDSAARIVPDGARGTSRSFPGLPPGDGGGSADLFRAFGADEGVLERMDRMVRVEVAVLRRQHDRTRCAWLASTELEFKTTRARGGSCDRGRWLKASGTRKWRLKLARRWPPGSYTLFSRAVNRGGVHETRFSRRDRNFVTFTIER